MACEIVQMDHGLEIRDGQGGCQRIDRDGFIDGWCYLDAAACRALAEWLLSAGKRLEEKSNDAACKYYHPRRAAAGDAIERMGLIK